MPTIKKLHPTLKACKCGKIGNRSQLYSHLDRERIKVTKDLRWWTQLEPTKREVNQTLFTRHGEVPLNEDDPRTKIENQLERSLQ